MQTYAWLVENVEHIHELRAYLRGKAYALTFTARKSGTLAVEREIVQAHVEKEIHSCAYLLHYLVSNLFLLFVKVFFHMVEPVSQLCYVEISHL